MLSSGSHANPRSKNIQPYGCRISKFCEKRFRNFSKFLFTSKPLPFINYNNHLNLYKNIVLPDSGINHALASNSRSSFQIMYQLYDKYICRKIFALSSEVKTPSQELEDGRDYVPTKKLPCFLCPRKIYWVIRQ